MAERLLQRAGQAVGQLVGARLHLRQRVQLLHHAEIAAGQGGSQRQIGVGIGTGEAVLHPAGIGLGEGHPQPAGTVLHSPLHVARRALAKGEAAIGVDVRRQQGGHRRGVFLQPGDEVHEQLGVAPFAGAEQVAAVHVLQTLVDVHGGAGLVAHRLGHKGGVDAVAVSRFPHGALEQEHLVGEIDGIPVQEVDLHLGGAGFVDQGIHLQLLGLAVVVHVLEDGVEFVDRIDAERLAGGLRATVASHRRHQGIVGVFVAGHQVEFQLGRHHRLPALLLVEWQNPAQYRTGGDVDQLAIDVEAVVDHLGGRLQCPGHEADGVGIGIELHVPLQRVDHAVIVRVFAGYRLSEDDLGKAHAPLA